MPPQIIDIHPHVVSPDADTYPHAPLRGKRSEWSKHHSIDFDQLKAEMDEAGIAKAGIVHSSTTYGYDASYAADCVMTDPHRFTGIYAVDILQPDAVEKIDYWRTRGMSGVRLFTGGTNLAIDAGWLTDPRGFKAWEHMADIGMTMCIQTTPEGLPQVTELLERFPDVNVILDHMARPVLSDGPPYRLAAPILSMARFPNLYLKITPRTFNLAQASPASPETFFPKLVAEYGANRLAFGSNYPANEGPLSRLVQQGHDCFACLSEEDRAWIWGRTAQLLYPDLAD